MYKFAIIGAGQIASGYDNPGDDRVLTHAHAISLHSDAALLGFYDTDMLASERASKKWGGESYVSLDHMMAKKPDVVIICTPDGEHFQALKYLLKSPPKIVLCEKPLTLECKASIDIMAAYKEAGVCLAINYQRRFDNVIEQLKATLDSGSLGSLLCGSVHYSKGIMHNGSHAVDLLRFLFGEASGYISIKKVYDFTPKDPSIFGVIRFEAGNIAFIPGDERNYSIFEMDLLFEKARYRFSHSGMKLEIQSPVADTVYPGYFELFTQEIRETGFTFALTGLVEECLAYLAQGVPMRIAAENILGTQLLCEALATSRDVIFNEWK